MKKLEMLRKIDAQINELNETISRLDQTLETIQQGLAKDNKKTEVTVNVQA